MIIFKKRQKVTWQDESKILEDIEQEITNKNTLVFFQELKEKIKKQKLKIVDYYEVEGGGALHKQILTFKIKGELINLSAYYFKPA